MGKRSIAAAVLVAAGLAVTTTGAASAGEPDDNGPEEVVVTCEDGEPVVREPTDEERERMRTRPVPPEWARVRPPARHDDRIERGGAVRVEPAEPGEEPPVTCDARGPHVERGELAVPALPH